MSVEFRPIKPEERDECLALWYTVFAHERTGFFERYFYGDVEWLPYYTQVAVLDGKLVSAVQTVKRRVECGAFTLTMGGVANVATLPEHRGNHFNTELLKRAIAVMEADAMDFSMLGTGINAYYERLGFCTRTRPIVEGTLKPDIAPISLPRYSVREATAEDLPALRSIYNAFNTQQSIAVQRDEAYWREWMRITPEKLPPNCLVACDAQETVRGSLSMSEFTRTTGSEETQGLRGVEFGADSGTMTDGDAGNLARELLREMLRRHPNATRLVWDGCTRACIVDPIRELLAAEEPRQAGGTMMCLLHRTHLFQSLTLDWNSRWIDAGRPAGTIAFQTPYGSTRIDANGTFLRVLPDDDAPDALPQSAFFGLLFGLETPASLTEDVGKLALLHALFPPRAFTYWGADGF